MVKLKLWVALMVSVVLVALAVPLAVGAEGLFPDEMDPALRAIEPRQQGPQVLVDSGRTPDGTKWRLTAYRSHIGLCLDLRESGQRGSGGGCGFGVRGEPEDVSGKRALSYASSQGPGGPTFIHGPTAAEVQSVAITLSDGRVLEVPAEAAPKALNTDLRFYATAFEGASVERLAAKNAAGEVVDTMPLAPPPH